MKNLSLNTNKILYSKNDVETYVHTDERIETTVNKDTLYYHQSFSVLQEFKKIIESELNLNDLIQNVFTKIKEMQNFQAFFIRVFNGDDIFFEFYEGCDKIFVNKLNDHGYIKLVLEAKKSLILYNKENLSSETQEVLILIPLLTANKFRLVYCLKFNMSINESFNRNLSLLEIIFDMLGKAILIRLLSEENQKLKSDNTTYTNHLKKEIELSTIGRVCLRAFHNLKNRTQVLVSSFNLLQKLVTNEKDEKLDKIFSILNHEVPKFSKAIKSLSEVSKNLANKKTQVYFDFDRFIFDVLDFIKTTGILNNLKFEIEDISQSKVYGNLGEFFQMFILIFLEFDAMGVKVVKLLTREDSLRITLTLKIEENPDNFISLLNENSSLNFVQLKNLINSNYCNLFTSVSDNYFEILISIPKRSSQFNAKELKHAKDFDC